MIVNINVKPINKIQDYNNINSLNKVCIKNMSTPVS